MDNQAILRSEGDRLQPALLDRLTDDEPQQRQETLQNSVVSKGRLKRTVLRDLVWLLNTTCHHTDGQLDNYPEVIKSVLNFGIPVLSGKNFSGASWRELERQIHEAILVFEPRILPDSLSVKASTPSDSLGHHNLLQFELRGELWSMPYPIELLLRSELDLETGYMKLTDQLAAGTG
ncbi:MAG: type VI secretion system baseplate subunit TssE [Rhodoferax sp.]|jgi:type VI secretion system protein ImpF|nr:type VI secretion system baseplate subunit TssE [Rhodoferax sp.]